MERLGYYAKCSVSGNLYEFQWQQDETFLIKNIKNKWVKSDPSKFEILEIGFFNNLN